MYDMMNELDADYWYVNKFYWKLLVTVSIYTYRGHDLNISKFKGYLLMQTNVVQIHVIDKVLNPLQMSECHC